MTTEVQEKTIEACAREVHAASQKIWEEYEAAAGHDAAERVKYDHGDETEQADAAEKARHAASLQRTPLVWEVFEQPGRWLGSWHLGPSYPDGRLSPAERAEAAVDGNLVVSPGDTEQAIANRLMSLRQPAADSVQR